MTGYKPAWLKSHQRFFDILGPGIDGFLAVMLEDEVASSRLLVTELKKRQSDGSIESGYMELNPQLNHELEELQRRAPQ